MRHFHTLLLLMMFVALLTGAAGCNIVGAGTYLIHGPAKEPAEYTLPQQSIVVFIDDRANVLPRSRFVKQIAMRTTNELLKVEKVVPEAIDPDAINREAARERAGNLMSIEEMGRKVGANIVIYAVPRQFTLVDERGTVPTCIMEVKVVDAESGARLWPGATQFEYHRLNVELAYKSTLEYDPNKIDELQQKLAEVTGLRLAQLFFAHEKNPLDAQVSD
jgi:hypothetical protein